MMAERMNDTGALSSRHHHLHGHQLPPRAGDLFMVNVSDRNDGGLPSAGAGDGPLRPQHRQPPNGGETHRQGRPSATALSTTTTTPKGTATAVAPETTNARGGGGPPRLGRRGDPRMHRAVAARLADPKMSLLDALRAGGFDVDPGEDDANGPAGKGKDQRGGGSRDGGGKCGDGVTLSQRKNQLSRRLRLVRQKDAAAAGKKGQRFLGGASRRMSGMSGSEWEDGGTDGDGSCCEEGGGSGKTSRRNSLFSVNLPPVTGIPMSSPELAAAQAAAVEAIKTRAANSRQKRRLSQLKEEQEQRERQQAEAAANSGSAGGTASTPAANNITAANDNGLVSLSASLRRERELLLMREKQKQQQQQQEQAQAQEQEQSRGDGHKRQRSSGSNRAGSTSKRDKNATNDEHLKGALESGGTAPPPLLLGGSAAGACALGLGGGGRALQDCDGGSCSGGGGGALRDGGIYSSLITGQQGGAAGVGASSFLPSPTAANNAIAASASSNIWNNPTTAATAAAMGLVDPSSGHGHKNNSSNATTIAAAAGGGTGCASLTPQESVYLELLRHQQEQLQVQQLMQAHYGGKAMTTTATHQQLNTPLSAQALIGGKGYHPDPGMTSSPSGAPTGSGSATGPTGFAEQTGPGTDLGALTWGAGTPMHSSNLSLATDGGVAPTNQQQATTTSQIASLMQQAEQAAAAAAHMQVLAQQQLGRGSGMNNNAGGTNAANSYESVHNNANDTNAVGGYPPSSLPQTPRQDTAAAAMFAMNGGDGVGCNKAFTSGAGAGTGTGTGPNHHNNFANLGAAGGGVVLPGIGGVGVGGILPPLGSAQSPSAAEFTSATTQTHYC